MSIKHMPHQYRFFFWMGVGIVVLNVKWMENFKLYGFCLLCASWLDNLGHGVMPYIGHAWGDTYI